MAEVFSPHSVDQRKIAFTLAEVLITLGIIGVVAAMTLPTLIQKQQDKELISRTKKVWADINNAMILAQQEYGVVGDNSFLFNATDTNLTVAKNLSKYFTGSTVCANASQAGCAKYYYDVKYSSLQLDSEGGANVDSNTVYPKIILSNGAIIRIASNRSGCEPKEYTSTITDQYGQPLKNPDGTNQTRTGISDVCANVTFDVNGIKNPNQYGRDVYYFYVYKNKLQYNASTILGGKSFGNILTGKDKLEYVNYSKGQVFEF